MKSPSERTGVVNSSNEINSLEGNDEMRELRRRMTERMTAHVKSVFRYVPGFFDSAAAPSDVLSVSHAVHRVIEEDHHHAMFHRSRSSPAELALLTDSLVQERKASKREKFWQVAWLVFLFVVLDASKSLGISYAALHGHMCAPLVLCTKNALSIACGMSLAGLLDGVSGVKQCLHLRRAMKVWPIAGAFCAAQVFGLRALQAFDPGSLKVISQVNLPFTALLSWLVLGRRYSAQQWCSMTLLLISTMAFLQVRMLFFEAPVHFADDPPGRTPDKVMSMTFFLAGIALSCFASILAERFLKMRYEVPFYIQKTNLMLGELVTAGLMVLLNSNQDSCTWEQIQDWRQLPVIFIWLIHGWMAGLLVKRCSVLVKNVSHILSALITYFLPLILVDSERHIWPVTLSALLVLAAVLVFATVPNIPQKASKSGRRKQSKVEGKKRDGVLMTRASSDMQLSQLAHGRHLQPYAFHAGFASEQAGGIPIDALVTPPRDKGRLLDGSRADAFACGGAATAPNRLGGNSVLPHKQYSSASRESEDESGHNSDAPPKTRLSCCSIHSVGFLVLSFIILDGIKPILVTWAEEGRPPNETFIKGSFILVQTSLSFCLGLTIAAGPSVSLLPPRLSIVPDWRGQLYRCVEPRAVLKVLPVSFCLCCSKIFLVMALGRLDAGTVRVFGQAALPLVGVGSALFFKRRYTMQQWCSLVAITIALSAFYYVKAEVSMKNEALARHAGRRIEKWGVVMILASIGFNCLGALLVEKFLKGKTKIPLLFHEQKTQLLLGEVVVNAALVFGPPLLLLFTPAGSLAAEKLRENSPYHRGLFVGWDRKVVLSCFLWIPAGWAATMLVKRCSNVLKTVAQSTSSVLTYVFSVFPVTLLGPPLTPEPLSSPTILLAITVLFAALTFGTDETVTRRNDRHDDGSSAANKGAGLPGFKAQADRWSIDSAYLRSLSLPTKPPTKLGQRRLEGE